MTNGMIYLTYIPRGDILNLNTWKLIEADKTIEIAGLYTFYYYEHDTNFYFPGERHDFWEIVYVDRGEISVVAENSGHLLKQGEIIFHKPGEFHTLGSTPKEPHNVMVVTFETVSPAMDFFRNQIFNLNSKQKKIFSVFLEEIRSAFAAGPDKLNLFKNALTDTTAYQLALIHLEYLLIDLIRVSSGSASDDNIARRASDEYGIAKKNVENALVNSLKDYLKENVYRNLSLQDICAHYHMSKSYICQLFKAEVGKSVIDYYIELKIAEAKYLIRKGEMNVTQISEKLGYAGIHHFSRSFKSKEGMSPSAYGKSILREAPAVDS